MNDNTLKLFAGNAHPALAQEVAEHLKMNLGISTVKRFRDGEIAVNIDESVRGADVYIVQPTCPPVNDNLMELLIMMDAMRRASAQRITAVIPYYGYARQERKSKARDPISAKLTANLIAAAGAYRVICMLLQFKDSLIFPWIIFQPCLFWPIIIRKNSLMATLLWFLRTSAVWVEPAILPIVCTVILPLWTSVAPPLAKRKS